MPKQKANKVLECRVLRVVTASLIGNRSTTVLSMWGIAMLLLWISATNLNAQSSGCGPGGPSGGGPGSGGPFTIPGGPSVTGPTGPGTTGGSGTSGAAGSQDPNTLTGPTGYGSQNCVVGNSQFAYQISFQNATNATAPARWLRFPIHSQVRSIGQRFN